MLSVFPTSVVAKAGPGIRSTNISTRTTGKPCAPAGTDRLALFGPGPKRRRALLDGWHPARRANTSSRHLLLCLLLPHCPTWGAKWGSGRNGTQWKMRSSCSTGRRRRRNTSSRHLLLCPALAPLAPRGALSGASTRTGPKHKNPEAPAVKREAEEDWSR